MSILIKGMEMPENCHECEFVDILLSCPCRRMADEDFWNDVSLAVEGHKDCPLVPVPPHGRLIDADAIRADIDEKRPGRSYEDAWALTIMDAAPTVLEAEEV